MTASPSSFRVLIVLPEPVFAASLASALEHRQVRVVGPYLTVDAALIALLHRTHLVAVLDLRLDGARALARTLEHWEVRYLALGEADCDPDTAPLIPSATLAMPALPRQVLDGVMALIDTHEPPKPETAIDP